MDQKSLKAGNSYFMHWFQRKKSVLVVFMLLFGWIGCSSEKVVETEPPTAHITAIDSLIQQAIELEHIPGAVIQIKHKDTVWHRAAYGFAQKYRYGMQAMDKPEPMTVHHLFDLASLTKVSATTFGIMLMIDDEKIALDDPISTYLPTFKNGQKSEITIRHLLTHSSGLPQWLPTYYYASNAEERYQYIAAQPLQWPVGEERHYSDLGFMLLGDIIEQVSGMELDEFLQNELYQPLGLEHTTFNPLDNGFKHIAATSHGNPFERKMVYHDDFGYEVDVNPQSWDGWRTHTLKGEVSDGNAWYANGGVAGHAGLFSTVDDLQVLVDLLMNSGRFRGSQLITKSIIDTFLTENRFGNGLGWAMDKDVIAAEGTPDGTFGHTGFTGTNMVAIPKFDLTIILLTNRQNTGLQEGGYYYNLSSLRQKLVDLVLGHLSEVQQN
jgi:CubicO group peptidase (beta-lactamase class C family)